MFLLHFPYEPVFTGAPWALPSILPGGARTFLILPAKREGRGHPVYLTPMKSITEGLVSQTDYIGFERLSLAAINSPLVEVSSGGAGEISPAGGVGGIPFHTL
jgi:hypothetical protein